MRGEQNGEPLGPFMKSLKKDHNEVGQVDQVDDEEIDEEDRDEGGMDQDDDELIETAMTFVGAKIPGQIMNDPDVVERRIDFMLEQSF